MTNETVTDTAATATVPTAHSPLLATALRDLDRLRADALKRADDCTWISAMRAKYPDLITEAILNVSGHVWITVYCAPNRVDDMAPFLRELREHSGETLKPRQDPDHGAMIYDSRSWYVMAHLSKGCTFKKVGTKTVEQPIYEISCK